MTFKVSSILIYHFYFKMRVLESKLNIYIEEVIHV